MSQNPLFWEFPPACLCILQGTFEPEPGDAPTLQLSADLGHDAPPGSRRASKSPAVGTACVNGGVAGPPRRMCASPGARAAGAAVAPCGGLFPATEESYSASRELYQLPARRGRDSAGADFFPQSSQWVPSVDHSLFIKSFKIAWVLCSHVSLSQWRN